MGEPLRNWYRYRLCVRWNITELYKAGSSPWYHLNVFLTHLGNKQTILVSVGVPQTQPVHLCIYSPSRRNRDKSSKLVEQKESPSSERPKTHVFERGVLTHSQRSTFRKQTFRCSRDPVPQPFIQFALCQNVQRRIQSSVRGFVVALNHQVISCHSRHLSLLPRESCHMCPKEKNVWWLETLIISTPLHHQ